MKSILPAAMAAAILLWAPAAGAAEFTPAPNASYVIDLDTEAGAYSEWRMDDLSGISAVRGQFRIRRLGMHQRWAPGFALEVGSDTETARIQITSRDRKTLELVLTRRVGQTFVTEEPVGGIEIDQAVAVAIDWTAEGLVTLVVHPNGGQAVTRRIQLSAAPGRITVIASTGEMALAPFQLGRTEP